MSYELLHWTILVLLAHRLYLIHTRGTTSLPLPLLSSIIPCPSNHAFHYISGRLFPSLGLKPLLLPGGALPRRQDIPALLPSKHKIMHISDIVLGLAQVRELSPPRPLLAAVHDLDSRHVPVVDLEPHLHRDFCQSPPEQDGRVDPGPADGHEHACEGLAAAAVGDHEHVAHAGGVAVGAGEEGGADARGVEEGDLLLAEGREGVRVRGGEGLGREGEGGGFYEGCLFRGWGGALGGVDCEGCADAARFGEGDCDCNRGLVWLRAVRGREGGEDEQKLWSGSGEEDELVGVEVGSVVVAMLRTSRRRCCRT